MCHDCLLNKTHHPRLSLYHPSPPAAKTAASISHNAQEEGKWGFLQGSGHASIFPLRVNCDLSELRLLILLRIFSFFLVILLI